METKGIPIQPGCVVTVELVETTGETDRRVFTVVPSDQADLKTGLLDEQAPLGRALLGHFAGQIVPYRVGGLREVRILQVEREAAPPSDEAASQRRADVRNAEALSEITNQMIFSTASGSKWGDYEVDMDKLLEQQKEKDEEKKDQGEET
jgi:hypothetical protein